MSYRLVWIFCLIVVGAALTLSFLDQRHNYSEEPTHSTNNNTPSVSFENIDMIINSPSGQPQYKVAAPKYWLYDKEQRSEFESPDIIIFNENGSKIFASAEKGETQNENDIITLIGNVEINQPSSEAEPSSLSISTDRLTVSQKKQQVTTDLPITATRDTQIITAVGMTLNLTDKTLYLHNDVKGQYAP